MKHILTSLACLVSIFAHGTVKIDTIQSYNLVKCNQVYTKAINNDYDITRNTLVMSFNPPMGIVNLILKDLEKNWKIDYNDSTITWKDVAPYIVEYQFIGGDGWVCSDGWGVYPNGYWSGVGAQDLYFIRDYLYNLDCIDLSRTVIQSDKENEKYIFPAYALCGHQKMTEVKIPRRTIKIDKSAFKDCNNLVCVNGSQFYSNGHRSVRYIHRDTEFERDINVLGEVDLSGLHDKDEIEDNAFSELVEIADSAFWGTQITKIQLPKSIKVIGNEAFGDCKIKEVTFYGNDTVSLGNNSFGKNEKDSVVLYVPKESLSLYRKRYGNRFKAIREIGYISPNPVNIYLKDSKLYIEIKEDASETGYVLINNKNRVDLKQGKNVIDLKLNEEYQVIVGDEEYMLNRYEL